jgi:hypothetical protein
MAFINIGPCGLYYKSSMILIYDCNDSAIIIYDRNDSAIIITVANTKNYCNSPS